MGEVRYQRRIGRGRRQWRPLQLCDHLADDRRLADVAEERTHEPRGENDDDEREQEVNERLGL